MASSAQSILISYFESEPDLADSDDARAIYAKWALESSRFCFSRAEYDNPKVCPYVTIFYARLLRIYLEMEGPLLWQPRRIIFRIPLGECPWFPGHRRPSI